MWTGCLSPLRGRRRAPVAQPNRVLELVQLFLSAMGLRFSKANRQREEHRILEPVRIVRGRVCVLKLP